MKVAKIYQFFSGGGAPPEPEVDYAQQGHDFLVANARTYHDFSTFAGSHGSTFATSTDLTANNRHLTNNPGGLYAVTAGSFTTGRRYQILTVGTTNFVAVGAASNTVGVTFTATGAGSGTGTVVNAPLVFDYKYPVLRDDGQIDTIKALDSFNNQPLLFANNTTNNLYATSHEAHVSLTAKSKNFILRVFGVDSTQVYYCQIETTGKITVAIKRAGTTTVQRSVDVILTQSVQNGDLGNVIVFGVAIDTGASTKFLKMYLNGCEIATELISGTAVSSWDNAYNWNNTFSSAVAAVAAATNTTGNSKSHWTHQFTVTNPLTQDQRNLVTHKMLRTAPQSGKLVILADSKMPVCTGNKAYYLAVYLSEQPASNVNVGISGSNVNITGSSLTFTPSNYNVPQLVKVVGTTNFGYLIVDLTLTMTGGFAGTKTHRVIVAQSRTGVAGKDGSDVYITDGYNAARVEANSISIPSASDLRNTIKTTLFKGNYPSGAPNSSSSVSAYGGITLTNVNVTGITNFMFRATDEGGFQYDNNVGYARNVNPNNKLFIQLFGHGESFHQELYNQIVPLGYDWAGACLAFAVANTENNPNLTGSPSWLAHDQLFTAGVDTATFDARSLFFHDKIRFLDYILQLHNYDEIVIAGVSGGGWAATMWASFDNRITKAFNVRGCNSYNLPESGSDLEQGPSFLTEFTGGAVATEAVCGPRIVADYRNLGYLKRMALICANGADYHQLSHELDPLGGSYYNQVPLDIMQAKVAQFSGGGQFNVFVNTNASEATHGFNTSDRQYIINNL